MAMTRKSKSSKTSSSRSGSSKAGSSRSRAKTGASKPRRRAARKRELINTGTDKRYVRRDDGGRFNESDDVGRSLSMDRKRKAKTVSKSGQGDRGDRRR